MSTPDARLRASEACCALFVARGTTDLTVAEIADGIGLSQRSFYRYFPIKAESVAPVFDWTTSTFDRAIDTAPAGQPLGDVLRDAFRAMLGGTVSERTRTLFPLVFADAETWSVFLRKVHDGERKLVPVLAPRLPGEPDPIRARMAAAAVASATRIALETMVTTGADPESVFVAAVDASGILRPAATADGVRTPAAGTSS